MIPGLRRLAAGDAFAAVLTVAGQLSVWLAFDGYYAGRPRPVRALAGTLVNHAAACT